MSQLYSICCSLTYKTLTIIYQRFRSTGEIPDKWRLTSTTPTYRKGQKEESEHYWPVSLTLALGKVIEQIILNVITQHMWDNPGTRPGHERQVLLSKPDHLP